MFTLLLQLTVWLGAPRLPRDDRGDVPGWVLITLMTAGIVAVLWGVAQGDLRDLFDNAVNGVKGPSN
jgi:hypothetical protein